MAKQVIARIESVPASESDTGHDEVYVVFDGKRIAMRAGTAYDMGVNRAGLRSCRGGWRVDGAPKHRSPYHSLNPSSPNGQARRR
jgi:hypothetical protein